MKHIMVWVQHDPTTCTRVGKWRYKDVPDFAIRSLKAQVDNTLYFGQSPEDVYVCTNFDFNYRGVNNYLIKNINTKSAWLNKIIAVHELLSGAIITGQDIWLHDVDAWQVSPFDYPEGAGDVATPIFYGPGRPHGASVFYRWTGYDIAEEVYNSVNEERCGGTKNDEIHMKHAYLAYGIKTTDNPDGRWTILDRAWCATIGQTAHISKPVRVVHWHPEEHGPEGYTVEKDGWKLVDDRLHELLKKYDLLTKLS